jgi:ubiquinone/menaquinone biosynthesis C-methylase UbiE
MSGLFQRRPRRGGSRSGGYPSSGDAGDATGDARSSDWRDYDLVAEDYERAKAPRTALVAADLVAMAALPDGGRVLDVGTGTGVAAEAARAAVGSGGLVVGIDPSLAMLRLGGAGGPRVAARALDLPFRDATFDALVANFVLTHFTKYETALFDLLRVLRTGGRLAASVWAEREDEFQRTWRELAEGAVGRDLLKDAHRRAMPWEGRFSDPAHLEETLRDVGLRPVRVERREYRFQMSREEYVTGRETTAGGRFLREMLGERGWESFQARARERFADRFPEYLTDFRDVLLAVGTKPA